MRLLRSRWTLVALVPACFLAGFAIVSALDDDPAPVTARPGAAAPGASTTQEPTVVETVGPVETVPPVETVESDPVEAGPAPAAPPSGTIDVDYGDWQGMFELRNAELVQELGLGQVTGELRYLGGADCLVGPVVLAAWFYGESGELVGRGQWESVWATGAGGEFPQREPLFVEAHGSATAYVDSAVLRFRSVDCL